MAEKSQMVMAGLWDEWTDKKMGERIKSCTIVTCPANALVGALYDRMPVILAEEDWAKWLGEEPATAEELKRCSSRSRMTRDHMASQQTEGRQRSEQGPRGGGARASRGAVWKLIPASP